MSPLLSCGIKIAFNLLTATQVLILFWVELENYITIAQAFDSIVQKSRLNVIAVCISAMLLAKIVEALLLWCKLICITGMPRSAIALDSLRHPLCGLPYRAFFISVLYRAALQPSDPARRKIWWQFFKSLQRSVPAFASSHDDPFPSDQTCVLPVEELTVSSVGKSASSTCTITRWCLGSSAIHAVERLLPW